jgi:hypothetical protein
MLRITLAGPVLILTAVSSAQVAPEPSGITVTVSRNVVLAPFESVFTVTVIADLGLTLEQAVALLAPLSVKADQLQGINTAPSGPRPDQIRMHYVFRIAAPLNRTRETVDALTRIRRDLDANMDLQFYGGQVGSAPAAFEAAREKALPEMLAEARRRAESVAAAGGVRVGRVLGVLDSAGHAPTPFPTATLSMPILLTVRFALD